MRPSRLASFVGPTSFADRYTTLHSTYFRVNAPDLYRFLLPRLSVDDMARVIRLYPSDLCFALRGLLSPEDQDSIIYGPRTAHL